MPSCRTGEFDHRPHPEQGYRACLGLLSLSKDYGEERLEGACRRALTIGCPTGKRIKIVLVAKLDQHPDMFPRRGDGSTSPPVRTPMYGVRTTSDLNRR